jgi:anti-anti-sigma factor
MAENLASTPVGPAELPLSCRLHDDRLLIEVAGDVDLLTSVQLREYFIDALAAHRSKIVVVDLSRVTFIDSAGLSLLLEARKQLATESRALHVILAAGHQPERILKITRFDSVLNFAYALDEITD